MKNTRTRRHIWNKKTMIRSFLCLLVLTEASSSSSTGEENSYWQNTIEEAAKMQAPSGSPSSLNKIRDEHADEDTPSITRSLKKKESKEKRGGSRDSVDRESKQLENGGKGKKSGKKPPPTLPPYTPHPNPSELTFEFPSSMGTTIIRGSTFDNTLMLPRVLAPLYPDFGGPHYAKSSGIDSDSALSSSSSSDMINGCKFGFDRVKLEMDVNTSSLVEGNIVGLTLSINGIEVAEQSVMGATNSTQKLIMSDVIFPPITEVNIDIQLDVGYFGGKISSGADLPPGGVGLPQAGALVLTCAPPFPIKGKPYNNGMIIPTKKPATVGSLQRQDQEKGCNCEGDMVQVLPASSRNEIYPKEKQYSSCSDYLNLSLPVLDEPFVMIDEAFEGLFYLDSHGELKVDTSFYYDGGDGKKGSSKKLGGRGKGGTTPSPALMNTTLDDFYNEICGGKGQQGTIRMMDCECEQAPVGFDAREIIFDFDVHCPIAVNV